MVSGGVLSGALGTSRLTWKHRQSTEVHRDKRMAAMTPLSAAALAAMTTARLWASQVAIFYFIFHKRMEFYAMSRHRRDAVADWPAIPVSSAGKPADA